MILYSQIKCVGEICCRTLSMRNGRTLSVFGSARRVPLVSGERSNHTIQGSIRLREPVLAVQHVDISTTIRSLGFFNKYSGDALWKGVTSVSNHGRKKGRATRVRRKIDFNFGQEIGRGKVQVVFPGLNEKVFTETGLPSIREEVGEDLVRASKIQAARDRQTGAKARRKLDPMDRGWSGTKWPGREIGPPDPVHGEVFEGFSTIVLEQKRVHHMTHQGCIKQYSIFAVTGNMNGAIGFGLGKSQSLRDAMTAARNRAGQQLMYIPRYDNHTVFHDFYTRFYNSKIVVSKQPEGYGLICHNAIREICKVIGIQNLHAKCEGATGNVQNVTKAFLLGLLRQKSHQRLADEKQLYLIERKEECYNFPTIVATPENGSIRCEAEIPEAEELDFFNYTMDNVLPLKPKKKVHGFQYHYSYNIYLKKLQTTRNREKTRLQLMVDYGDPENFYKAYSQYIPELRPRRN